MNIEFARSTMITQQIRPWEVLDDEVLELLYAVRREAFVPPAYRNLAFMDTEIPLPCGQNMLAPKLEARILQESLLQKHEKVLEIGSGSGYMAALLAHLGSHVTTIEIEPELCSMAQGNLDAYGISNVEVVLGNGARGWQAEAPYDVIVISGSLPVLPDSFRQQLRPGGRLLAIVGDLPVMRMQRITRLTDGGVADGDFRIETLFETVAAPLRETQAPSPFIF